MNFLLRLVLNAVALYVVARVVPGIRLEGAVPALIAALLLGIVNAILRPILIVLSCPLEVLTLGLFTLVINGLLFLFVAHLVPGFVVAGFWPAFWGAIVMAIVSFLLALLFPVTRATD
ncbi:MAG TPA: phage holin family protein [Candidatus Dormibacteraeota bacterium]|nr:phage holin family protein [Candidatus Dormibacteraeota bacterium]